MEIGKDTKGKQRLIITDADGNDEKNDDERASTLGEGCDYEVPAAPEIEVKSDELDLEACVSKILDYLEDT